MTRPLEQIAADMAINAHARTGGAETLHPRADDLLIETIERLAASSDADVQDMAGRIIQSWRETPRWYS